MTIQITPTSPNTSTVQNQTQPAKPQWSAGDIFSASYVSKAEGVATLQTADGFTFTASAKHIQGETGDTLRFQVVSENGAAKLKQLFVENGGEGFRIERGNAEIADFAGEVKEIIKTITQIGEADSERAEEQAEEQAETSVSVAKAVANIRKTQGYLSANTGKPALAALVE